MKHRVARFADAPSAEALDNHVEGHFVFHHGGKRQQRFFQERLELLRLRQRPREAIQKKAGPALQAFGPLPHHVPDGGVGNELAPAHEIHGFHHGRS